MKELVELSHLEEEDSVVVLRLKFPPLALSRLQNKTSILKGLATLLEGAGYICLKFRERIQKILF